jgi:hypothetical protein
MKSSQCWWFVLGFFQSANGRTLRKGKKIMGYFKNEAIESEKFDEFPPPRRVADMGVEPMPFYDRPKLLNALEALEWAKIATPTVSRDAQAKFLVKSLTDQGADWDDFEALVAFGWDRLEIWAAAGQLGVEL